MGIDNGGTSCKAVLFDSQGNEIACAHRLLTMITPCAQQTERDMDALWHANVECIREAIEKSNIDPSAIKAVAGCGHGKGLYLCRKDGSPVRNGIVSTDGRAGAIVRQWQRDGTAEKVFKRNYQNILACQPVALLAWLKQYERKSYDAAGWIFAVKDFIRYRLTGKAFAEITDYSGSNLLDVSAGNFNKEILDWFGIGETEAALPPLKKSTDVCGYIPSDVSKLTLLPEGIPVAGGMFDIDACSIAMNVVDPNNICCIAGTWSINEYIAKQPIVNRSIMMNSKYFIDDYYLLEESSATSAGNIEWYIARFLQNEKNALSAQGKSIYAYCDDLVASIEPEDQDIIFLPFIYGSNYNPDSKACFIGVDSHHTQAHFIRAVFEGIVFSHMVHIEKLLHNKRDFASIRLAGGAANSAVWTQMFADVTGYPVEAVKARELGALGAAMAASVVCGDNDTIASASRTMTHIDTTVLPRSDKTAIYRKKFSAYKKFYQGLERYWNAD